MTKDEKAVVETITALRDEMEDTHDIASLLNEYILNDKKEESVLGGIMETVCMVNPTNKALKEWCMLKKGSENFNGLLIDTLITLKENPDYVTFD